jgi:hypothetical protein
LGKDGEDPISGIDYEEESYFDKAFIVGPAGLSQTKSLMTVLDLVRPRGIQVFVKFVEKHIIEEFEIREVSDSDDTYLALDGENHYETIAGKHYRPFGELPIKEEN